MTKQTVIGFCVVITIIVIGISIWFTKESLRKPTKKLKEITISTTFASFVGYPFYVAYGKGYFKEEGIEIIFQNYPHGKANLNAVIEKKVNLGLSSETPFMYAVLNGEEICVIGSMVTAKNDLAVVAREDRGILIAKDLEGKTIGVTIGSNGEYFLELILLFHGVSLDAVNTVNLKPNQMVDSLLKGKVDAIATWNPQQYIARNALGNQGRTFYAEGLYAPLFLISARQEYVRQNPETIERVVRSLIKATQFIRDHPAESQKIVAQHIKLDKSLLSGLSATYNFKISLTQSLLITLENQTRWAIEKKLTEQPKVPNYLNFICRKALKAIKPNNITIISTENHED